MTEYSSQLSENELSRNGNNMGVLAVGGSELDSIIESPGERESFRRQQEPYLLAEQVSLIEKMIDEGNLEFRKMPDERNVLVTNMPEQVTNGSLGRKVAKQWGLNGHSAAVMIHGVRYLLGAKYASKGLSAIPLNDNWGAIVKPIDIKESENGEVMVLRIFNLGDRSSWSGDKKPYMSSGKIEFVDISNDGLDDEEIEMSEEQSRELTIEILEKNKYLRREKMMDGRDVLVVDLDGLTGGFGKEVYKNTARELKAVGVMERSETKMDFFVKMFVGQDMDVLSNEDWLKYLDGDETIKPRPLLYIPENIDTSLDVNKIHGSSSCYLLANQIGRTLLTEYPCRDSNDLYNSDEIENLGVQQMVAAVVFHPSFGNGERDEIGRLMVTWPDGRRRPISGTFFHDMNYSYPLEDSNGKMKLIENSPRGYLELCPQLLERDILRKSDFEQKVPDKDDFGRTRLKMLRGRAGLATFGGVTYTFGSKYAEGGYFITQLSNEWAVLARREVDDADKSQISAELIFKVADRDLSIPAGNQAVSLKNLELLDPNRNKDDDLGIYEKTGSFIDFINRLSSDFEIDLMNMSLYEMDLGFKLVEGLSSDEERDKFWEYIGSGSNSYNRLKALMLCQGNVQDLSSVMEFAKKPHADFILNNLAGVLGEIGGYEDKMSSRESSSDDEIYRAGVIHKHVKSLAATMFVASIDSSDDVLEIASVLYGFKEQATRMYREEMSNEPLNRPPMTSDEILQKLYRRWISSDGSLSDPHKQDILDGLVLLMEQKSDKLIDLIGVASKEHRKLLYQALQRKNYGWEEAKLIVVKSFGICGFSDEVNLLREMFDNAKKNGKNEEADYYQTLLQNVLGLAEKHQVYSDLPSLYQSLDYGEVPANTLEVQEKRLDFFENYSDKAGISKDARINDWGCGDGWFVSGMVKQGFDSTKGLDFAESQVSAAIARHPELLGRVVQGNFYDSRGMANADVITLWNRTVHHVENENNFRALAASMSQSVVENGLVMFDMGNADLEGGSYHQQMRQMQDFLIEMGMDEEQARLQRVLVDSPDGERFYNRFFPPVEWVVRLMKENKLDLVERIDESIDHLPNDQNVVLVFRKKAVV